MNNLLIQDFPLMLLPNLAKEIGLPQAVILQQIHYWQIKDNVGILHDGRKWVYNTHEAWQEQFCFWSVSTIKRALKYLSDHKFLFVEQLKKSRSDMTNYYSINYKRVRKLERKVLAKPPQRSILFHQVNLNYSMSQISSVEGGSMGFSVFQNSLFSTETTTNTTHEITPNKKVFFKMEDFTLDSLSPIAWSKYCKYRRKILKKPLKSKESCLATVKLLVPYSYDTQLKIVQNTIDNDWVRLFPENIVSQLDKSSECINENSFDEATPTTELPDFIKGGLIHE